MLLVPGTLGLAHRAEEIADLVKGDPRFKLELPASQLEIITTPSASVGVAAVALLEARRDLVAAVDGAVSFAAAGAHPVSPGAGRLNRGARYEAIVRDYRCVAHRQLVCALQVHVAIGGSDRTLAVYNAVRSFLPLLAALAANAPFYEAADSGLASVRPKVANLLPRQGIPPSIESWDEYLETLTWGAASGAFPDPATWWWELRLHPRLGTLEFRVPDAQTTVSEAAAIAAVVQTLVAWLGAQHDAGETLATDPSWRIEQNRWSACRDGVEGELPDLQTGERCPTRERLANLFDALQLTAATLNCERELARARQLAETNGAIAQRRIAEQNGVSALPRWLSDRFLAAADG